MADERQRLLRLRPRQSVLRTSDAERQTSTSRMLNQLLTVRVRDVCFAINEDSSCKSKFVGVDCFAQLGWLRINPNAEVIFDQAFDRLDQCPTHIAWVFALNNVERGE